MEQFTLDKIGTVLADEDGMFIVVEEAYRPALSGLEGFSHLNILWWASGCDNPQGRRLLQVPAPYKLSPPSLGIFATRSPARPNPLCVSPAQVLYLDVDKGIIALAWIDAANGTPVLDIKPYTPSVDRVMEVDTPQWCAHWPASYEQSAAFDWEAEFNF